MLTCAFSHVRKDIPVRMDLGLLHPGKVDMWPQPPRRWPLARPEWVTARNTSECRLGMCWLPDDIVSLRGPSKKRLVCSFHGER